MVRSIVHANVFVCHAPLFAPHDSGDKSSWQGLVDEISDNSRPSYTLINSEGNEASPAHKTSQDASAAACIPGPKLHAPEGSTGHPIP